MNVEQPNKNTVAQPEETIQTSLWVSLTLWKRVRNFATERRETAASLWNKAMQEYLDRNAA